MVNGNMLTLLVYFADSYGAKCYRMCDGRTLITNITSEGGSIGSYRGQAVDGHSQVYCMWILTPYSSVDNYNAILLSGSQRIVPAPKITLTVEIGLSEFCGQVFELYSHQNCASEVAVCYLLVTKSGRCLQNYF